MEQTIDTFASTTMKLSVDNVSLTKETGSCRCLFL